MAYTSMPPPIVFFKGAAALRICGTTYVEPLHAMAPDTHTNRPICASIDIEKTIVWVLGALICKGSTDALIPSAKLYKTGA